MGDILGSPIDDPKNREKLGVFFELEISNI